MALNIGILFGDQDNPFWQEQVYWYKQLLPGFPFNAGIFFPEHARDAQCQARLLAELLERDFDALVINPLNGIALADTLRSSCAETMVFDVGPKLIPELTAGLKNYVPLRVTDFFQQGWLCVKELTKHIESNGPFAFICGPEGTQQSAGRIKGAEAAAADSQFSLLPPVCGGFTREGGRDAISKLLAQTPCAVFCANDLMALGALEVLVEHGIELPVGGVDLIPDALASVKAGGMTATVGPRGEDIVRGVLRSVERRINTGELPDGYLAENILVA